MKIDATQFDAFSDALVKFGSETTDPKAALVPSYMSIFGQVGIDRLRYIVLVLMHLSMLIAQCYSFVILRRTGTSPRSFRQISRSQFHQLRLTHSFLLITRASDTYQTVSQSKVCIVYLASRRFHTPYIFSRGHYHDVSITSISPSILKTIIDEHEVRYSFVH